MSRQPPFDRGVKYFAIAAAEWIKTHRPTWTSDERQRTIECIWFSDWSFRQPFLRAVRDQSSSWVAIDGNDIPTQPHTELERLSAYNTFKSGRQSRENPGGLTEEESEVLREVLNEARMAEDKQGADTDEHAEDSATSSVEEDVDALDIWQLIGDIRSAIKEKNGDDQRIRAALLEDSPDIDSGIDLATSRSAKKVSESQRSSKSSASSSSGKAKKTDKEAQKLKEELERLRGQLQHEQEQRRNAENEVADRVNEVNQLREKVQNPDDTYPFSFWPRPPWHADPPVAAEPPPYEWSRRNVTPVQKEHNPHEGRNQFARRMGAYNTAKNANMAAFLAQRLHRWRANDDHTWHGARFLGSGAYGSAGLWVRVDGNRNIVDRMVGKESQMPKEAWENPIEWRKRLPREIYNHRLLDSTRSGVSHRTIIRHRGYRLMMTQRRFRIYLDLCTGGSLDTAVWDRIIHGFNRRWNQITPLPEPFIWHVFKELVDACRILQQGNRDTAVPGWKSLTHNDIHLGNVLLDQQQPEDQWTNPRRPRIILADYGRMFDELNTNQKAPMQERDNPREYRLSINANRYPYETWFECTQDLRITEKTDVWMIGAVIWYLMSHTFSDNGPSLDNGQSVSTRPFKRSEILQGTRFPMQSRYSNLLKNVVARCLAFHPSDRPSVLDLQEHFVSYNIDTLISGDNSDPGLVGQDSMSPFAVGRRHR